MAIFRREPPLRTRPICKDGMNKKLSCRRETTRRFMSLNILLSHSSSFEVTLLVFHWNYVCILRHSASKNGVTLKLGVGVFQGYWNGAIRYDFLLDHHCKYSSMLYFFYRAYACIARTMPWQDVRLSHAAIESKRL